MPPAPSEPEKYSIDEMMERLKGQSSENPAAGELVTRPDGSQALRVRKRKRRSEQPKREEAKRTKRIRTLQVAVGLVLLLLTGLVMAGAYVYANTAPYSKAVTAAIASSTGANVEIKQFRVSPASANAESITLEWPEGSALKGLHLSGVSANISPLSILGTQLSGDEVAAREGSLWLLPPPADTQPLNQSSPSGTAPVQFSRISAPKFNIVFGEPSLPALKIFATEASLRIDKSNSQTTFHLYHGNLQLTGWPIYKIDRAVVEFRPSETKLVVLRVTDSQLKHGIFDLTGKFQPFGSTSPTTLTAELANFDFAELLGSEFSELIGSKIDSRPDAAPNSLTFLPDSPADAELKLAFKSTLSTKVNIKGFPFLSSLVRTLNDKWYENPSFVGDFTGIIHRKNSKIELHELQLESKSRMAIHAELTSNADKSLSGIMEIGIPESIAHLARNSKINSMLSEPHDGYRWLSLKIGGSLLHPSDNFSALYAAAKESDVDADEPAGDKPDKALVPDSDPQKAFDDITRPKGP